MQILAISGSLRSGSHNGALLRAAAEEAPRDVDIELWDGLKEIPPFDQDDEIDQPLTVEAFRDKVRDADAVVFATPEYNSSIPGALKNALDWASRPIASNVFRNKPVAVIGSSAGAFGAVWAQAELRKVLAAMGARVADVELAVGHAAEKFDENGALLDGTVRQELHDAVSTLVELTLESLPVAA
jgi:chromate reductase, NAD(P)H dehydrogenase (quinone)